MNEEKLRNIIRNHFEKMLLEQDIELSPYTPEEEKFLAKFFELKTTSIGILYSKDATGVREFLNRSGKDFNLTPNIFHSLLKQGTISIVPYGGYARNEDYTVKLNIPLEDLEGLSSGDAGGEEETPVATEESVESSQDLAKLLVTEQKRHTQSRVYAGKSRTLKRLPKGYINYLERIIQILGSKLKNEREREQLVADILDNLAHNFGLTPKQVYRSFIYYRSQNRLANVVRESINEQGQSAKLPLINFAGNFESGKHSKLPTNLQNELTNAINKQIRPFLEKYKNNKVTITIESGESQVTNADNESNPPKKVPPKWLATRRSNTMKKFLTGVLQDFVKNKLISTMPEIVIADPVIGPTPYKKGSGDLTNPTKQKKYKEEQFVRLAVAVSGEATTKKTNPCIFDLSFTIAYDKGNGHTCDQAIFELIANGVNLGICNLNNSWKDEYTQSGQQGPMSIANEYNKKQMVSYAVEQNAVGGRSRYSDGQKGGSRAQEYIINETLAKQILKNSPQSFAPKKVIRFELQPLVGKKGRYSMFYNYDSPMVPGSTKKGQKIQPQGPGSHSDVPRVIIKNKEGVEIYNKTPSVKLSRNSMKKTRILIVDECGKPFGKSA